MSSGPTASTAISENLSSAGGVSIPYDTGEAVVNARLFWTVYGSTLRRSGQPSPCREKRGSRGNNANNVIA